MRPVLDPELTRGGGRPVRHLPAGVLPTGLPGRLGGGQHFGHAALRFGLFGDPRVPPRSPLAEFATGVNTVRPLGNKQICSKFFFAEFNFISFIFKK